MYKLQQTVAQWLPRLHPRPSLLLACPLPPPVAALQLHPEPVILDKTEPLELELPLLRPCSLVRRHGPYRGFVGWGLELLSLAASGACLAVAWGRARRRGLVLCHAHTRSLKLQQLDIVPAAA